ncbi:MAG: hypothetical protein ACRYFS_07815 [Janthinobacterium lividum]
MHKRFQRRIILSKIIFSKLIHSSGAAALVLLFLIRPALAAPTLPALGEWDGVTASAHLQTPYEDPLQSKVPFGTVSYYMQPWRSYMDTWSAQQYEGSAGAVWTSDAKYADALGPILHAAGIRTLRYEIGWGNLDFNDQIPDYRKHDMMLFFDMCRKYGIRPMILLNANDGDPCPERDVPVMLTHSAKKGDTVLHLVPGTRLHEGYTGPMSAQFTAAYPLITHVDADGTAHLSAALDKDFSAGTIHLSELKYQPFQGDHLADGTPVPACQDTFDGWGKYVAAATAFVRDALGTSGKPDAGFDMEVWNEFSFGSKFLEITHYYDVPPKYKSYGPSGVSELGAISVYTKTRPLAASDRPDARTQFQEEDYYSILGMTIDYMHEHRGEYPGVKVINGFSNQSPFADGTDLWPHQTGFSRHYYTSGWQDVSPQHAPNITSDKETECINAAGKFEGKLDGKDWDTVTPGSVFIPTLRIGYPEYLHSGFKTESLSRDILPDSRYVYFDGHGRYTNNGDLHPAEVWQTEVNYWRNPFFEEYIFKDGSIKHDDPQALALDEHINAKNMLRQYLFHNHKGLKRIYLYQLGADPYSFGIFPARFFAALDASKDTMTAAVRETIPQGIAGLTWLASQMDSAQKITAPRPLKVEDLVEYKPRLVMKGDGTAAHPDRWNRDWFTFLPYQLTSKKYLIPYYVQTLDETHVWNKNKKALDPARWDMPPQDYDVTLSNIRGKGASVSVLDPLTMKAVPATVVKAAANTITVHLSAVDYPRFLTIQEVRSGPLILDPVVQLTSGNRVRVTWRTNQPATVSLTYGSGWENRSAQEVDLKPSTTSYTLPAVIKGVVAVRIKASASGLRDVWPRWDEDPQGQIVAPGGMAKPSGSVSPVADFHQSVAAVPLASLAHGTLPALPSRYEDHASGWSLHLPAGVTPVTSGTAMEAALSTSAGMVMVRMRYLPNAAVSASEELPYAATGDEQSTTPVTLSTGVGQGTFYTYHLTAAAHPGMSNLSQVYLLIPSGLDLLVLSASGPVKAMSAASDTLISIASSISPGH